MRNRILPLIVCAFLITNFVFAQKCGTHPGYLQEDMLKYPNFYESLESKNIELEIEYKEALSNIKNKKTSDGGVRIIPVVVHVIHDMGTENISDESIQNAIDILNANINGQADNFLANTPDVFAAVRGDAKIDFRLAKRDPKGNPTTGINRVRSTLTSEPEPRNAVKALSYWNSYQYLNIWTVKKFAPQDDGNTLLGYAQFPETGSMSTDGVVLISSQMVNGGTLTHEVGHWLGLRHTWGDAVCGDDDVKDTPPSREPNYGVSLGDFPYHVGSFGCLADSLNWAGEMFVNYMDYTSDQYCTMFTRGQVAVMNETLDGLFNEEDSTSGIGYREYMWSQANIDSTGTGDGYTTPFCSQEASFVVIPGATSICQGEALVFRGNKTMFGAGNVNSFVWDFGDGNTDNSGSDFLSHTYNTVSGVDGFDVTLTVEYDETTVITSSDPDLFPGGPATYDNILVDHMVQGTYDELLLMGANNITEIAIDSLGLYFDMVDSSYFRGYIQKVIYTATYVNTCTTSLTREGFVNVNDLASSSVPPAASYDFESESDLNDDWKLVESTDIESFWSFNSGNSTTWQWEGGVGIDSSASIKIDADDMLVGVSAELVSKPYNLSAFSTPAMKFSWAGASFNTFPVNQLAVNYSDDCGETWRVLGTISPIEASNAGLYATSFKPSNNEWSSIVMTDPALKNSNIRFKFEYIVNGSANNFYLDNIMIGEQSSLMLEETVIKSKLSVFPNPANTNVTVLLDQFSDKKVEVNLINILGAKVSELFSGEPISDYHEINIDLRAFEKGIYFIQVVSGGDVVVTDKLLIE